MRDKITASRRKGMRMGGNVLWARRVRDLGSHAGGRAAVHEEQSSPREDATTIDRAL